MSGPLYQEVIRRLKWWRLTNLCQHFFKHRIRRLLEPGVYECLVCGTATFTEEADDGAFMRWLAPGEE